MMTTLLYLIIPCAVILLLVLLRFGLARNTFESYFVANRNIGIFLAALSFPVCWLWANTLIIGPQGAYESGISNALWFAFLNGLALFVFAIFSTRAGSVMKSSNYTLTGYIAERFDRRTMLLFMLGILGVCVYAVAGQFIATVVLLQHATGISAPMLAGLLGLMMFSIAASRGLQSSYVADIVKATLIAVMLVAVGIVVARAGGFPALASGFGGIAAPAPDLFDWKLLRDFVIPLAVSWISGGAIDHQLWQRRFALSPNAIRAVWMGIIPFILVVFSISTLGFVAAASHLSMSDHQLAGFVAVNAWLPMGSSAFILMIAAALLATGASALNAAASVWAVDVWRSWKPLASEVSALWVSRAVMCGIILLSVMLALKGVTLKQMVLFIGSFRGALFFPMILAFFFIRVRSPSAVFTWGIGSAMIVGPLAAFFSTNLWGGVVALSISGLATGYEWVRTRRHSSVT